MWMTRDFRSLNLLLAPLPADQLVTALAILSGRERAILELRFGLKDGRRASLQEVGQNFGVTGERIRQIEARAIGKLRRLARSRPRQLSARPTGVETPLPIC